MKAVGGMYQSWIDSEVIEYLDQCRYSIYRLTARKRGGTGPFLYAWSTGETTQSIDVYLDATDMKRITLAVTDSDDGTRIESSRSLIGECYDDGPH